MVSATDQSRANVVRAVVAYFDVTGSGLARIIGCSQPAASRKLSGERTFTADELQRIAEHFGIDSRILLEPGRLAEVFGTPDPNGRNPAWVTAGESRTSSAA
jgi:transcriptional regulator with XRE-family HTH domain